MAITGCSRAKYRLQADREAYDAIAERNVDPRWCVADYRIETDPRSRYFDPCDPDFSPMPPDDPASHQYMHLVGGMKGWKHWHCNGDRTELENPAWREALAEYVEIGEDGSVKLNTDSALRLAYVHSPSHQTQLETLYLSALDVTRERFRLDTQYFGGYDVRYAHNGSLIPAGLGYVPALGRFVVTPPIDGVENNRVTVGRPFAGDPALQARRRFATAGELLVGFANSFVFEFTEGNANLATSLANFSFIQPLLRGAGRDVALEQLTIVERALLANLRAYSQYRQGLYTQVAIGELGVAGPQRGGAGTNVAVFPGQGVGGYIGLLQQLQRIRNTEDSLSLQLRTRSRLEAYLDDGLIDLVQVDQFRQSIESERSGLLQIQNAFELSVDRYKADTLGLAPDLPVELDDGLIRQFQLVARQATAVQDSIAELQGHVGDIADLQDRVIKIPELQDRVGKLPDEEDVEEIRQVLTDVLDLVEAVRLQLDDVQADLARMEEGGPAGEQTMTDVERDLVRLVGEELREGLVDLKQRFEQAEAKLTMLRDELSEETRDATVAENVVWLGDLLHLVQGCTLVQARVRLQVEPIRQVLTDVFDLVEPVRFQLDDVQTDLARMEEAVPTRERMMADKERDLFQLERDKLREQLAEQEQRFAEARAELEEIRDELSEETRSAKVEEMVVWLSEFYRLAQVSILIQARARLEAVNVETIELSSQDAFEIAIANRLDFMNARAALVDRWRLIQFDADALQSVLNVTADGDIRTARNNPVSFRAPTGSLRLGLEFDAPFTRLEERNDYRQSLIDYQQSRRGFIRSRDSLHLGLRELLRQIEQLRTNLEIQRGAVAIAIRQVDMTQEAIYAPVRPPEPGRRPAQFGPTAATNLLTALSALRNTQNNFMSVWLSYYAARMRLARELGIMKLDQDGTWIDDPLPGSSRDDSLDGDRSAQGELSVPPAVPTEWIELLDFTGPPPNGRPVADVDDPADGSAQTPPEGRSGYRRPGTPRIQTDTVCYKGE